MSPSRGASSRSAPHRPRWTSGEPEPPKEIDPIRGRVDHEEAVLPRNAHRSELVAAPAASRCLTGELSAPVNHNLDRPRGTSCEGRSKGERNAADRRRRGLSPAKRQRSRRSPRRASLHRASSRRRSRSHPDSFEAREPCSSLRGSGRTRRAHPQLLSERAARLLRKQPSNDLDGARPPDPSQAPRDAPSSVKASRRAHGLLRSPHLLRS